MTGLQQPDGIVVAEKLSLEPIGSFVSRRSIPLLYDKQSGGPNDGMLEGGAYLEQDPSPLQDANALSARLWLNGFPIEVNNTTEMKVMPTAENQRAIFIGGPKLMSGYVDLKVSPTSIGTAPSSDKFYPGMYLSYQAITQADGNIFATSLTGFPNVPTAQEYAFRTSFSPPLTEPDYESSISGRIVRQHGDPIEIVPDRALQSYIQNLGSRLIPAFQNQISSSSDATKIHLRFYVVHSFQNDPKNSFITIDGGPQPDSNGQSRGNNLLSLARNKATVDRVVEMPNGVVLIPDIVLPRLRNTAQLSFVLSAAIQVIVQKQAYLAESLWKRTNASYYDAFWQNQRSIRMGIHEMYLAGYDIREAPFAWAFERAEPLSNPVMNPTSTQSQIPWYAAYAFDYISKYYQDVDFSKLKRGEAEYQQFLKELRVADPEAFAGK